MNLNMIFLGVFDIAGTSLFWAILAGISQFLQAHYMPKPAPADSKSNSFQDNFAKSMQVQMKYVLPLLIVFIAYRFSGAVALYWITNNIFTIGQQIYAQKKKISIMVHGHKLETEVHVK